MKSKFKSAKSFEERTKDAAQIKHEEWDFIFYLKILFYQFNWTNWFWKHSNYRLPVSNYKYTVWVFYHGKPNDSESRNSDCWVRPRTSNYLSSPCRLASRDKQIFWFKMLANQVMEDRDDNTCGGEPINLNFFLLWIPSHLEFYDPRLILYPVNRGSASICAELWLFN